MILADIGTTYTKILDTTASPARRILPSRELPPDFVADIATGHRGRQKSKRYVNELTAMARSGEALLDDQDFLLLDCGSRDIKFVRYADGNLADMGWNTECGASMGFSVELLLRYYGLDCESLPQTEKNFAVTCGVLGMSSIFDAIINGMEESEAIAAFVRGIAMNAYRFAGSPKKLYLSGGMCSIPAFVNSFPCKVQPLGRYVLLDGLARLGAEQRV